MSADLTIAIETSGRAGSVAIGRDFTLLGEVFFSGYMRHSAELFNVLDRLLDQAHSSVKSLKRCCITGGPGSFTGLRIAVTTAKMLSLSRNVQIVAADTMDVLAENAAHLEDQDTPSLDCIATILDAKKNLFYTAVYERIENGWNKCLPTQTMTAEELLSWLKDNKKNHVGLLGEGLVYYADAFRSPFTTFLDESLWSGKASSLLSVGQRMAAAGLFANPQTLTPTYLRSADAVQMQDRKQPS